MEKSAFMAFLFVTAEKDKIKRGHLHCKGAIGRILILVEGEMI
jgi:hypothetical protein